jgi:hypothetical protein
MKIYCCGCQKDVEARLTSGAEIYPHREDLHKLPFWLCETCFCYVGCHHKTKNRTRPLGNLPTGEMRSARQHIHKLIDPIWQNHPEPFRARCWIYRWLAWKTGKKDYHTGEIRSIEEAREIYRLAQTIKSPEDCRDVE